MNQSEVGKGKVRYFLLNIGPREEIQYTGRGKGDSMKKTTNIYVALEKCKTAESKEEKSFLTFVLNSSMARTPGSWDLSSPQGSKDP